MLNLLILSVHAVITKPWDKVLCFVLSIHYHLQLDCKLPLNHSQLYLHNYEVQLTKLSFFFKYASHTVFSLKNSNDILQPAMSGEGLHDVMVTFRDQFNFV